MKNGFLVALIFLFLSCKEDNVKKTAVVETSDSSIEIVDFEGFQKVISGDDEKTYVVNFWATWCKPCIKELPAFEKLNATYKNEDVEVILVSLDFKDQLSTQLEPFIKKRGIASRVILMDDPKENEWLPKVSESWSGAIPATVIKKGNKQIFYEKSFTYDELEEALKTI